MLSSKLDWQVEAQEFWLLMSPALLSSVISMAWNKIQPVNPDQSLGKPPQLSQEHKAQPLVFPPPWKLGMFRLREDQICPWALQDEEPHRKGSVFYFITACKVFSSPLQVFDLWSTLMGSSHGLWQGSGEAKLEQLPPLEHSLLESPKLWNFPLKCAHPNLHLHSQHILDSQPPARFISWQLVHNLLTFYSKTFCLLEIQVMGRQWCPFSMLVTQNDKLSSAQRCPLSQQCFVWSCFKRRLFM